MYLRDQLLREIKDTDASAEAEFFRDTVTEYFNSGLKFYSTLNAEKNDWANKVECGFLSNASAAAKSAGFKGQNVVLEAAEL